MPRLEGNDFPCAGALAEPFDGRFVHGHIELAWVHPDELFAAPAHALAGLSVDIHDSQLLVQQKEGVRRTIDKRAEALLARAQFLLGVPPIGDIGHEAHHALRSTFGVEEHATFRPQPVGGAVLVNHPVLGRDIAGFVRALDRELYRRPVVGMDELLPAFEGAVECSRLEAVHRLELRRPAVFALASADVPVECHRACRQLRKLEHFLSRLQLSLDALARALNSLTTRHRAMKIEKAKHVLPRNFERMRWRDEQVEAYLLRRRPMRAGRVRVRHTRRSGATAAMGS